MAEETTLDAFVDGFQPGPIEPTMVWRPDGATCVSCGGTDTRLWRADAGLVCAACKPWTDE